MKGKPLIRVAGVDMSTFTDMRGWRGGSLARHLLIRWAAFPVSVANYYRLALFPPILLLLTGYMAHHRNDPRQQRTPRRHGIPVNDR